MRPKDTVEFIGPVFLLQVEVFIQSVNYYLVGRLGLTIAFRVPRARCVESDPPPFAELSKFVRYELRAVVGYYFVRQTVATDDVFPYEPLDFFFCYVGEGFCLDPLRKVVC